LSKPTGRSAPAPPEISRKRYTSQSKDEFELAFSARRGYTEMSGIAAV
jgi:hypothetical protein